MAVNLLYIFRVSIAIAVFYLAFMLLFRKQKLFLLNRFYMIGAMLIAFVIPLITFRTEIIIPAVSITIPVLSADIQPLQTSSSGNDWKEVFELIFFAGVAILFIRIVISHLKVRVIVKNASPKTISGYKVWITSQNVPPFTYFRKLVIPSTILDNPYLNIVLSHEQIHAKEQHCLDIYLTEILCMFQWFNPFAWLLRKAVRDNLEFMTDDHIISKINRQEYQLGMVSLASNNKVFVFPTISNKSQLEKRIIMMRKSKSTKKQWGKVLVLVPILALLTVTLSGRETRFVYPEQIAEVDVINNDDTTEIVTENHVLSTEQSPVDQTIKSKITIDIEENSSVTIEKQGDQYAIKGENGTNVQLAINENGQEFLGKASGVVVSENVFNSALDSGIVIIYRGQQDQQDIKPLIVVDGEKRPRFDMNQIDPETIKSMTVLKNETAINMYGEDAKNGVIIIETKNNAGPWNINDILEQISKSDNSSNPQNSSVRVVTALGIPRSNSNRNTIEVSTIETINNSDSGSNNTQATQNFSQITNTLNVRQIDSGEKVEPLYIIDGMRYSIGSDSLKYINTSNIESIQVLKDETAVAQYGEDAKNGVIIIETKKNTE